MRSIHAVSVAASLITLQLPLPTSATDHFTGSCSMSGDIYGSTYSYGARASGQCNGSLNGVPGQYWADLFVEGKPETGRIPCGFGYGLGSGRLLFAGRAWEDRMTFDAAVANSNLVGNLGEYSLNFWSRSVFAFAGNGVAGSAVAVALTGGCSDGGYDFVLSFGDSAVAQSVEPTAVSRTIPALSTPAIPPIPIGVPAVAPIDVETPPIPVPLVCTPGNILCVGPFTIPPQPIITTPEISPQTVVTTPPISPIPVTPEVTIAASTSGLDALLSPSHAGQLTIIGPLTVDVPTPFGSIPITVCASTCPFVTLPDVAIDGSVTVTVTVGSTTLSRTVPVQYS